MTHTVLIIELPAVRRVLYSFFSTHGGQLWTTDLTGVSGAEFTHI